MKFNLEPLPMRLRALPPSFWQQPNQPNVSPSTMYLPPLFKNEIENVNSDAGKFLIFTSTINVFLGTNLIF